jgi:hypothetical protein
VRIGEAWAMDSPSAQAGNPGTGPTARRNLARGRCEISTRGRRSG